MSSVTLGLLSIAVILVLVVMGVHIGVAIGAVGFFGLVILLGLSPTITLISTGIFTKITSFEFLAVLFFTWAGMLASSTGLSQKLFECLKKWFGKLPGGLGIAATWCCAAFGTVCSSCMVTAMVFSKIACPEMRRAGYDKRVSYGLIAAAGNIGQMIPPSSILLIYAVVTEMSVGPLLVGGIMPGLILTVAFSLTIAGTAIIKPQLVPRDNTTYPFLEKVKSSYILIPFAIIIGIVLLGVYTGICSIAESAALCCVVLIIAAFIARVPIKKIFEGAMDGISSTAMALFLISGGVIMSRFMTMTGTVNVISEFFLAMNLTGGRFLLAASVLYLFLGCFLDSMCQIMLTVPIFFPMLGVLGVNEMQFSMVLLLALHCGMITPPFGLNVFGMITVAEPDVKMGDIFWGAMPYLVIMIVVLVVFCFFPGISTFLPSIFA